MVPVEVGINFQLSSEQSRNRFGLGAYLGLSLNNTEINETNIADVKYRSSNPCATILAQEDFWLSKIFSIVAELGYRYQTDAITNDTFNFGSGYRINYSGIFLNAGIEFKF